MSDGITRKDKKREPNECRSCIGLRDNAKELHEDLKTYRRNENTLSVTISISGTPVAEWKPSGETWGELVFHCYACDRCFSVTLANPS